MRSEHISNTRSKLRNKKTKAVHGVCPECNYPLVVRSGPYGEFLGCSQYPKCHFKQNKSLKRRN